MKKYDFMVVGSGLFGSVFAREAAKVGRSVLILEKRSHVGGNVANENIHSIDIHSYGPHIFHTSNEKTWNYVNELTDFWQYKHKVKANYNGKIYSLPFNLQTYYEIWGCSTPEEAGEALSKQLISIKNPANLEEWALANIGPDLYETLVYGYTKKQWMRNPKDLPASLIRRIPMRMSYDDNYYRHIYQGIPIKGYNHLIEQLIDGIEVKVDSDFFEVQNWRNLANKLVYSGSIDQFFNYDLGYLEYRGLRFEHEIVPANFQGIAQMNFTDEFTPYTRIVEHGHFTPNWEPKKDDVSIITYEYPIEWEPGLERYYPVNDEKNNALHQKYKIRMKEQGDIVLGGRLGFFIYIDMDQAIGQALTTVKRELNI